MMGRCQRLGGPVCGLKLTLTDFDFGAAAQRDLPLVPVSFVAVHFHDVGRGGKSRLSSA